MGEERHARAQKLRAPVPPKADFIQFTGPDLKPTINNSSCTLFSWKPEVDHDGNTSAPPPRRSRVPQAPGTLPVQAKGSQGKAYDPFPPSTDKATLGSSLGVDLNNARYSDKRFTKEPRRAPSSGVTPQTRPRLGLFVQNPGPNDLDTDDEQTKNAKHKPVTVLNQSGYPRLQSDHTRNPSPPPSRSPPPGYDVYPPVQSSRLIRSQLTAPDSTHERQPQHVSISESTLYLDKQFDKEKVTTSLNIIFDNSIYYRRLLSCDPDDAQKILDAFQALLDTEHFDDRGQLISAMRRLSARTNLYPTRFFLEGRPPPFGDEPVTAGSFADIHRFLFQGEDACFKVIRLYQRSQVEHMTKVYAKEAILWAQLSHPNILPFYGLVNFGSRLSFVSRWAKNGNLEDYLSSNIPGVNRLLLCFDTAAGVEYLHKNDIVHGDLKGANVLIDSSGRAALGDFGLASVTDPQILTWSTQSTEASKGGTTRWQAPELLASEDTSEKVHNSKASDVFAWANICYEIFTGRLPFYELSKPTSVMLKIMQGDTPTRPQDDDPAWIQHGLNDNIWGLMKDCWNFEPLERPATTTVMVRLDPERPEDSRSAGEWGEKMAMRFRNAQGTRQFWNMRPFWEELDSLLSRIVPEI